MIASRWHLLARGRFALEAAAGNRFSKDVLHVGRFLHPETGETLEFAREDLEHIAAATNRWIALGHEVWFSTALPGVGAHNRLATADLGRWSHFRVEGDDLVGDVEVTDPEAVLLIGRRIRQVSAGLVRGAVASTGETFDLVIEHVAATPAPVIPGQGAFVQLARETTCVQACNGVMLSSEEAAMPEQTTQITETPAPAPAPSLADQLKALLRLPAEADEGAILDAVRKALAPHEAHEAPEDDTEMAKRKKGAPHVHAMERSADVDALKARVVELERANKAIRADAARREIELAREQTAEAGIPLDEDARKIVEGLFASGSDVAARKMLSLAIERATDVKRALVEGARFLPTNGDRATDRADLARDRVKADMLLGQGYSVEMKDGRIVRAVPPGAGARKE